MALSSAIGMMGWLQMCPSMRDWSAADRVLFVNRHGGQESSWRGCKSGQAPGNYSYLKHASFPVFVIINGGMERNR